MKAMSLAKKKKPREKAWSSSDPECGASCLSQSIHLVPYQLSSLGTLGPPAQLCQPRAEGGAGVSIPAPGLLEPLWLPRCCSEPTMGKQEQGRLQPPALGASLPQHSQSPLPSFPAGAGTPEQKKIMIIICCVILGIVIASTFGGIFG